MPDYTEKDLLKEPVHKLRTMCKELGLKAQPKDKKVDLIKMILTGEEKDREKPAPKVLENKDPYPKARAVLPESVKMEAEQMGVQYTVDEDDCCVTFHGQIPICCNLDSTEQSILRSLRQTRPRSGPVEVGTTRGSFV